MSCPLFTRLDLKVAFVACVCFAALQLDRGNVSEHRFTPAWSLCSDYSRLDRCYQISNALSDNFIKDIHMTTNDCQSFTSGAAATRY
jgi:hypothetical protein